MRKFKTLGLAVVAVLAMSLLAGAGSASATTICSSSTSPCPSPYSGTIHATLLSGTTARFTASFLTINCNQSTVSGTTNSSGVGSTTAASWTNNGGACPNNFGGTCTSQAQNFPWNSTATYDPAHAGGRDGYLVNVPTVTITCNFPSTMCTYTGNNASGDGAGSLRGDMFNANMHLTYPSVSDTKPNLALENVPTNTSNCTSTATYSGTYQLEGTNPPGTPTTLWILP